MEMWKYNLNKNLSGVLPVQLWANVEKYIREVIVGVCLWLAIELFVGIWWASNVTTRVTQIEKNMIRGAEISERLACVETQLINLNGVISSLSVELRDLRRNK